MISLAAPTLAHRETFEQFLRDQAPSSEADEAVAFVSPPPKRGFPLKPSEQAQKRPNRMQGGFTAFTAFHTFGRRWSFVCGVWAVFFRSPWNPGGGSLSGPRQGERIGRKQLHSGSVLEDFDESWEVRLLNSDDKQSHDLERFGMCRETGGPKSSMVYVLGHWCQMGVRRLHRLCRSRFR